MMYSRISYARFADANTETLIMMTKLKSSDKVRGIQNEIALQ